MKYWHIKKNDLDSFKIVTDIYYMVQQLEDCGIMYDYIMYKPYEKTFLLYIIEHGAN